MSKPIQIERGVKYRDADKMALIPVKNVAAEQSERLRKPEWMKIKLPADSTRSKKSNLPCATTVCTRCVKKLLARIWLNALTTAPRPS